MLVCTQCHFQVRSSRYKARLLSIGAACPWCGTGELKNPDTATQAIGVSIKPFWLAPSSRDPLVTVIIRALHEPQSWVNEAIESALSQGVDVEVIVVEDGRPEPLAIHSDHRVGWYRQPATRGMAAARNAGLAHARGKYVRMLDGDDQLPEGALRLQIDALEAEGEAKICFGMLTPFGDVERVGPIWGQHNWLGELGWDGTPAHFRELLLADRRTLVPGPSAMWERSWGPSSLPEDFVTVEDAAFYRLAISSDPSPNTCRYVQAPVLNYRLHEHQSTNQGSPAIKELRQRAIDFRELCALRLGHLAAYSGAGRKVAVVEQALNPGGAQWVLAQVALELRRSPVEMRFLCGAPTPLSDWLARQGVLIETKPSDAGFDSWAAQRIQEECIEIVDTSWAAKLITPAIREAAQVCCVHVQSARTETAGLLPTNEELLSRIDHYICVSEGVREIHRWVRGHLLTIPNGVDGDAIRTASSLRELSRLAIGAEPGQPVVVWSGRLQAPTKRTDILRQLVHRFRNQARFVVLGMLWDGSSSYQEDMADWQQWCAEYPVSWYHNLRPWELHPLLAASDIYLSTSDVEGMSLSLLEAAVAECFPVTTDTTGTADVVTHGVTGLISPIGDVVALAANLDTALRMDPHERSSKARQLGHLTIAQHDMRECARQHLEFYLSC